MKISKEEDMVDEKVKEVKGVKVVQVPTQFADALELPDGTQLDLLNFLALIYNDIQQLKKGLL